MKNGDNTKTQNKMEIQIAIQFLSLQYNKL